MMLRLSEKETDMEDKLSASISYLQKLGPEYINQVFESSRWIFEQDHDMVFQVILVLFLRGSLLTMFSFLIQDIYVGRR
jgi:hypothetical protein